MSVRSSSSILVIEPDAIRAERQPLNLDEPMTKDLSIRETQILRLIAEGKENREIAQALGISVRTVEAHRARIMLKLDLESVTGLVRYAVRHGIIEA